MNLAVIPARSGSKRIRDKNVIDFCGKPMISYPLAAAQESGLFDTIHVSTDSEKYADVVRGLGFDFDFLRDGSVSGDDVGIIDVLRWVVRQYRDRGKNFETVCLIYATAALIEAKDIQCGYDIFVHHKRQTPVLSVTTFSAPVQRAMKAGSDGILEPVLPENWERHSQTLETAYHDAGAFFFIDAERLANDEAKTYNRVLPCIIPRNHAVDIDEPEDLALAEQLCRGRLSMGGA
ncbi:MAG: pseudaminic acid cytidylyltransferase [Hyphomicrobiales bacterium]|nr:pseudaminic acid cytidylyltransferase [Hyphomicrobiales bacterium]